MKSPVYDIESYPNIFTNLFSTGELFEISWRKNEVDAMIRHMMTLDEMIGFNNMAFDYPILHFIIQNRGCITSEMIFEKVKQNINTPFNNRFSNYIWDDQQHVPQIDLMMIHHFDNKSKMTSLKALEIAMRSRSVEDLPFPVGKILTWGKMDKLIEYQHNDVEETVKFAKESEKQIAFRRKICADTGMNAMNFNDTKIGKKYFEMKLEEANPGCCKSYGRKRQTPRLPPYTIPELSDPNYNQNLPVECHLPDEPEEGHFIDWDILNDYPVSTDYKTDRAYKSAEKKHEKQVDKFKTDYQKALAKWPKLCKEQHEKNLDAVWIPVAPLIFDYIEFERPEFQDVLDWYKALNVTNTKSGKKSVTIDGFSFDCGLGGIHGSVASTVIKSSETHTIRDIDVASYYPNLAIKNKLYPEHLGEKFCEIYQILYEQRKMHKKGTTENAMLKLALNGVYGDSGSKFSVFYDPKYMISITINGQLLLMVLAEQFLKSSAIDIIQINTDGVTIRHPKTLTPWIEDIESWWMEMTNLMLENISYQAMFIRDVNNYMAWFDDGKLKRKGAYMWDKGPTELEWHNDHSGLVIQKAVEAYFTKGADVEDFITNHSDKFDFMMKGKVNRNDRLVTQDRVIRGYDDILDFALLFSSWDPLENSTGMTLICDDGKKSSKVLTDIDEIIKYVINDITTDKDRENLDFWKNISLHLETNQQHIIRFYFSKSGGELFKYMPPLKKTPDKIRRSAYPGSKGTRVKICNHVDQWQGDVDFDYYINEAWKLIRPLEDGS